MILTGQVLNFQTEPKPLILFEIKTKKKFSLKMFSGPRTIPGLNSPSSSSSLDDPGQPEVTVKWTKDVYIKYNKISQQL